MVGTYVDVDGVAVIVEVGMYCVAPPVAVEWVGRNSDREFVTSITVAMFSCLDEHTLDIPFTKPSTRQWCLHGPDLLEQTVKVVVLTPLRH